MTGPGLPCFSRLYARPIISGIRAAELMFETHLVMPR